MKLSKFALIASSLFITSIVSQAAVSLTFSAVSGAASGALTNLASSTGVANVPRVWGIIVDTGKNGFKVGEYQPGPALAAGGSALSVASGVTDDVLYIAPLLMVASLNTTIDGGTLSTGLARPNNYNNIPTPNGSVGQPFMIVWFDATALGGTIQGGDKYGALPLPAFTIPADGAAVNFSSNFVGVEPVRMADMTFVPETSTALLGALGALGLLRRRR